jgi:hypothetical protein
MYNVDGYAGGIVAVSIVAVSLHRTRKKSDVFIN